MKVAILMPRISARFVLLSAVVVCLWTVAIVTSWPARKFDVGGARSPKFVPPADSPELLSAKSPEDAGSALQRPIFHASRRPLPVRPDIAPVEPNAAALPNSPPPSTMKLRGAILTSGKRIAVLQHDGSTDHVRLEEGADFDGWTLRRIEPKRVTFVRQRDTFTIELAGTDANR
jgi:hypothetical protein